MNNAERSWIDAITNAALLGGFNTGQYLKWLDQRPVSVNDVLPQFLHEATHHWCFDSIVGNTIALLRMRARRLSLRNDNAAREMLTEDLVRFQTASLMLRPLSEGLALFAEFDTSPGKSEYVSRTLTSALMCFGFGVGNFSKDPEESVEIILRGLLQTMRRRHDFVQRKAGVLATPFECEEGYLPGYMAVKALRVALVRKCPEFEDRDLFLGYLRSYFYDDGDFVLTILSEERDEVRLGEKIANYVVARVQSLLHNRSLRDDVQTWVASVVAGEMDYKSIGSSAPSQASAYEKMISLVSDALGEGLQADYATHAYTTVLGRLFLILGRASARVRVAPDGTAEIVATADEMEIRYTMADGPPPGDHDGHLLIATSTASRYVALLLVLYPNCFVLKSFGDIGESDWEDLSRHAVNYDLSTEIHDQLEGDLLAMIERSELKVILDHNRQNVLRAADHLYGNIATLTAPEPEVPGLMTMLRVGGFLSLLDSDVELLKGLAAIGLANTVTTDVNMIRSMAEMMELDPGIIDRTLADARSRRGMILIDVHENQILAAF